MPTGKCALYLLLLAGAVLFYIAYYGWFAGFLLIMLLLLPLISLAISLPGMRRVQVTLSVPAFVARGEGATAVLTGRGRFTTGRVSAAWRVTYLFTEAPEKAGRVRRLGAVHSLPLSTAHSGAVRVEVRRVRVYDLLGLFWLPGVCPPAATLTVLPIPCPPEPTPEMSALLGQAQALRPKPGGGFAEEHDLRDYRPGDPLNSIHWKLTSKMNAPIVREALIPETRHLPVTVEWKTDPEAALSVLCWLTRALLDEGVPFCLCWREGEVPREMTVEDGQELPAAWFALLGTKQTSLHPAGDPHRLVADEKGVRVL